MQETNNKYSNQLENDINLQELVNVLWQAKGVIISVTAVMSVIGVMYSLLLPNIYQSKALLVPVIPTSNISRTIGNYNTFAGLAGVSLPSNVDRGNSAKALEKISSLSFFEDNILNNIFLPDLMAVKSWDSKTNTIIYDDSIYNIENKTWVGEYSQLENKMPSAQKSFSVFKSEHLSLVEDRKSGFITLSIKHQSPFVAKKWAELVVNEVNSFYRLKDKLESEKAVGFINNQISMTGLSEIKRVLAELLQEETKKLTLIEANEFYVFDYIDPPAVMERKSEPSRALICILSAIFGGMLGVLSVLIRHYIFRKDN